MLDIILIQHVDTGIKLLEYRQEETTLDTNHMDIFSGFLSAMQSITEELDIGTVVLISTEGTKGHNCIIVPKDSIAVVLLVDQDDPVELWKEQAHKIANKFIEKYGKDVNSSYLRKYQEFLPTIKEMCMGHRYCD